MAICFLAERQSPQELTYEKRPAEAGRFS